MDARYSFVNELAYQLDHLFILDYFSYPIYENIMVYRIEIFCKIDVYDFDITLLVIFFGFFMA